jgi:hypothetical protein
MSQSADGRPERHRLDFAVDAFAVACSVLVFALYAWYAAAVVAYPWDWEPDEGFALDAARRLWEAPSTLYPSQVVPFPWTYTPLLPVLLAPLVRWAEAPLGAARLLACVWTAAIAFYVYRLASRKAPPTLALIAAALALAPFDLTHWHVMARVDGLMTALWLAAGVVLLPPSLRRGAARLSWTRALGGALLLVASVLAKPTAAFHGFPLVAGWLLVDGASARRLLLAVSTAGLAALIGLQLATSGGFLSAMSLWLRHPRQPGQSLTIVMLFVGSAGLLLLFALLPWLLLRRREAAAPWDGAWLLVAGGLAIVPALAKAGAWWNYLLPLLCASAVLGIRGWGAYRRVGALAGAALALGLSLTQAFPLPSALDRATADAFYGYVRERGRPLLALRPDYAYFLVRQPIEVDGASFYHLVAAGVPGTERIREGVENGRYRLIVAVPAYWPGGDYEGALQRRYRLVGVCQLGFSYGITRFALLVPRDDPSVFAPPAGTRCQALTP